MMTKKMVDQAASGKTSFQYLMIVAAAASSIEFLKQLLISLRFDKDHLSILLPVAIVTAYIKYK